MQRTTREMVSGDYSMQEPCALRTMCEGSRASSSMDGRACRFCGNYSKSATLWYQANLPYSACGAGSTGNSSFSTTVTSIGCASLRRVRFTFVPAGFVKAAQRSAAPRD